MNIYLFSDEDYSHGNAIVVIASTDEKALELANKYAIGFDPSIRKCKKEEVGDGTLIEAQGYYRPKLSFIEQP